MLTASRITWHVARLVPPSRGTALNGRFLAEMHKAMPRALDDLSALRLRLVFFGCTSASFTQRLTQHPTGGPVVVDAFRAITQELAHVGARRIQLLTPYEPHLTTLQAALLDSAGFQTTATYSLSLTDDFHTVTTAEILDGADQLGTPLESPDALVISCTNLHTVDAVQELRKRLGIPVVSSNTAIAAVAERLRNLE